MIQHQAWNLTSAMFAIRSQLVPIRTNTSVRTQSIMTSECTLMAMFSTLIHILASTWIIRKMN